jgi:ribosomal-protein-alanine N-acetyltransferase
MIKIEDVFGTFPILETEQLLLRQITLDDAQDMIKKYERICLCDWGVVYKRDNKFIGTCGYGWWSPAHARAEIGYALSRKFWNRGLMTEALREVIKFGFEIMRLNRIEARCFLTNHASEKVMQKVGMKFEGIQREGLFAKGEYQDLKVYSLLRKEFYGKTELS